MPESERVQVRPLFRSQLLRPHEVVEFTWVLGHGEHKCERPQSQNRFFGGPDPVHSRDAVQRCRLFFDGLKPIGSQLSPHEAPRAGGGRGRGNRAVSGQAYA
jgi:hypothetical protein